MSTVPGASGVGQLYVPTLELSGNLMLGFSRNVKSYNVNRYAKLIPVKKDRGAYLYFYPQDNARLTGYNSSAPTVDGNAWASGTPSPLGHGNSIGWYQGNFFTKRYAFPITLDGKSVDLANWPVQKANTEALAQRAMTRRAISVVSKMLDSSIYPTANYAATAGGISDVGASLYTGTTAAPYLKKFLDYAMYTIQAATMGAVRMGQLAQVMNAKTAMKLSQTREIREYVMQQANAGELIKGEGDLYDTITYGLPRKLYSVPVVVEDLFYDASNRPASSTRVDAEAAGTAVFADNKIVVLSRTQEQEGVEGAQDHSSFAVFMYEDMTVESKYDSWNRLLELRVVDDYDVQATAPVSSFLCANIGA